MINSQAFLQSPIWDGPRMRNMAERALREGNAHGIKIAWPFIHAASLSSLFLAHRPENKSTALSA
jgi:hypothetical protein